jgi:hypothetical protein
LDGCSKTKLVSAQKYCASDVTKHGRQGIKACVNKWKTDWNEEIDTFLETTFKDLGDVMPDSDTIHMLCYIKLIDLWNEFISIQLENKPHITLAICITYNKKIIAAACWQT